MAKEINRVSFEIEHYDGDTYMGFMLSIKDDGSVDIIKASNCSLADVDGDYIFNTENSLYRMQADEPISEDKYEEKYSLVNSLFVCASYVHRFLRRNGWCSRSLC